MLSKKAQRKNSSMLCVPLKRAYTHVHTCIHPLTGTHVQSTCSYLCTAEQVDEVADSEGHFGVVIISNSISIHSVVPNDHEVDDGRNEERRVSKHFFFLQSVAHRHGIVSYTLA